MTCVQFLFRKRDLHCPPHKWIDQGFYRKDLHDPTCVDVSSGIWIGEDCRKSLPHISSSFSNEVQQIRLNKISPLDLNRLWVSIGCQKPDAESYYHWLQSSFLLLFRIEIPIPRLSFNTWGSPSHSCHSLVHFEILSNVWSSFWIPIVGSLSIPP